MKRPHRVLRVVLGLTIAILWPGAPGPSEVEAQQANLDEPFFGITTNGERIEGLFPIHATGVSTAPVVAAARAYLATLTPTQVERTSFGLNSDEWRHWSNVPVANLARQGLPLRDMSGAQREAALALVRAGLSARAFGEARKIMQIDGWLADFNGNHDGYGEDLYYLDIFGEPSESEPWGWQIDGHHLVVNYFVMGDQVVMSPNFWGAEPVYITEGPLAGLSVLQEEQDSGLRFMETLRPDQRREALIGEAKTRNNALAAAFRDNIQVEYAGIRGDRLDPAQREALMEVVGVYAGHLRDAHAQVRMEEVRAHLDDTWFAWIGEVGPEALYYYRIQSPVVLIEFDHTTPVSLRNVAPPGPSRNHFHITVRTPNGNDYGKDLLRQHYEIAAGDPNHRHQ